MSTQSIPAFQQLNIPGTPSPQRCGLALRQGLSYPSVHSGKSRENKVDRNRQVRVIAMRPLVKRVAFKIRQRLPSHVEMDDLVADGVLGLLDALAKFDSNRRVAPSKPANAP